MKDITPMPSAKARETAAVARANGCEPFWYDGIFGWAYHCGCEDETHFMDQQCSTISEKSAQRKIDNE